MHEISDLIMDTINKNVCSSPYNLISIKMKKAIQERQSQESQGKKRRGYFETHHHSRQRDGLGAGDVINKTADSTVLPSRYGKKHNLSKRRNLKHYDHRDLSKIVFLESV